MSPFERLRGAHLTSNPLLEDFLFSLLSLLVIAVALTAVLMPPKASVAAAVAAQAPTPNPNQISVYGTVVDATGNPISPEKHAQIRILYPDGRVAMTDKTQKAGTFSGSFTGAAGAYTIEVTITENGVPITGSSTVNLAPGYRWGIRVVFTEPSTWVFVPLPGY